MPSLTSHFISTLLRQTTAFSRPCCLTSVMSRMTSPSLDPRDPKRTRMSLEPEKTPRVPENVAEIVPDGDCTLVVSGMSAAPDAQIGLRVSRMALSMASPVFRTQLNAAASKMDHGSTEPIILELPKEDNGDAMFILCNILHLRNDKLAPRIPPDLLCKVATLARKYECVVAAGRATLQWFDRLYSSKESGDLWKIIEAAYLLDEAMFFARFTSRWVLQESMYVRELPFPTHKETYQLSLILSAQLTQNTILLRQDLDTLTESCIFAFSREYKHYIDWAPTMSPSPHETPEGQPPVECRVDPDGATTYLGALHDAALWPASSWQRPNPGSKGDTIGSVVEKLAGFREPEYDDSDKCEFCEGVRTKFLGELARVRVVQKERLWGLCLDCYKSGGVNAGECRFEHPKSVQNGGSGILGL